MAVPLQEPTWELHVRVTCAANHPALHVHVAVYAPLFMTPTALEAAGGAHAVHTMAVPEYAPVLVEQSRLTGEVPHAPTTHDQDHVAPDTKVDVARVAAGGEQAVHTPPQFVLQLAVAPLGLQLLQAPYQ